MSAARWLLRAAWVLLAAGLLLQAAQLVSALRYLAGPDAFAVSAMLMAALAFKGVLVLANLVLLLAVHIGLRRMRAARTKEAANLSSTPSGTSP